MIIVRNKGKPQSLPISEAAIEAVYNMHREELYISFAFAPILPLPVPDWQSLKPVLAGGELRNVR